MTPDLQPVEFIKTAVLRPSDEMGGKTETPETEKKLLYQLHKKIPE